MAFLPEEAGTRELECLSPMHSPELSCALGSAWGAEAISL